MSSRTPLVLLHGALGTQAQFDPLLPLLSADFDILTLDFEGHGRAAPGHRPFQIENFAENVLQLMDARGIAQTPIFGYSMGGYVALYLALTQPKRVSSVFTLATKLDWTPQVMTREIGNLDANKILAKVPQYAAMLQAQHGAAWREVLDRTKDLLLMLGESRLLNEDTFIRIRQRIRITVGDQDITVSVEECLAVYRSLPRGELQVFLNTPHPLDRVLYALLATALREFFG